MSKKSKMTSKGQVTIPNAIRKALNIEEGDYLIFEAQSEYEASVRVVKATPLSSLQGALKAMQNDMEFADIRKQARDDLANRKTNYEVD